MSKEHPSTATPRFGPTYATIWRWHFYAGLFCLPFFCWLAITGSVYLFRPEIEAWLDRPYESLHLDGPRASPSREARAAEAALPGAVFSHYEPPATPTGMAQVVVARDGFFYRVYIHPVTLRPMKIGRDDHRLMDVISHLHGNLLLGTKGSMIVETAGSWGVVMILTGLCLWFPRGTKRLGGFLYPRLSQKGRLFWRDLHAVTGAWICVVTLFLLVSGLPWSSAWGNYFTWIRNHWTATAGKPDWSLGGKEEPIPSMSHDAHVGHLSHSAHSAIDAAEMAAFLPPNRSNQSPTCDVTALDTVVPSALSLNVPRPFWVIPPPVGTFDWIVSSRNQNRPKRVAYALNSQSGVVTGQKHFSDDDAVNRTINVAVAAHEGQLFGRPNQAILLANALGILVVTLGGAVMWWRRRPAGQLGAPKRDGSPSHSALFPVAAAIVILTVALPLFGASLIIVVLIDRTILLHFPSTQRWLGT